MSTPKRSNSYRTGESGDLSWGDKKVRRSVYRESEPQPAKHRLEYNGFSFEHDFDDLADEKFTTESYPRRVPSSSREMRSRQSSAWQLNQVRQSYQPSVSGSSRRRDKSHARSVLPSGKDPKRTITCRDCGGHYPYDCSHLECMSDGGDLDEGERWASHRHSERGDRGYRADFAGGL